MTGKHARPHVNEELEGTSTENPEADATAGNIITGPVTTGPGGTVTIIGGDQITAGRNVTINRRDH